MFNKLKNKIKTRMVIFLEIDVLINDYKKQLRALDTRINNLSEYYKDKISKQQSQINSLHRTLEEVVKVGVDIDGLSSDGNSWAVVCFNKGNTPIVKFINLRGYNPQEIVYFLRRFDSGRYTIDSPIGHVMENELYYNWKER